MKIRKHFISGAINEATSLYDVFTLSPGHFKFDLWTLHCHKVHRIAIDRRYGFIVCLHWWNRRL